MSHAFDSGLALPVRSLIRASVAGLLAPKLKSQGGYLHAITGFPRVIADRHDEDGINHAFEVLGGRAPALLVAVGDAHFTRTSTAIHRYQGEHVVQVVTLSNSGRGLLDRLILDVVAQADDTADPGIDVMLEQVGDLVAARSLEIAGVHAPTMVGITHLETEKALSLWAINFTVSAPASVKPTHEQLERLTLLVSTLTGVPAPTHGAGKNLDVVETVVETEV